MLFFISFAKLLSHNQESKDLSQMRKGRYISSPSDFFEPENAPVQNSQTENTQETDGFSIFGLIPILSSIFFPRVSEPSQKISSNHSFVCRRYSFHLLPNGTFERNENDCSEDKSESSFFSPKTISSPLFNLIPGFHQHHQDQDQEQEQHQYHQHHHHHHYGQHHEQHQEQHQEEQQPQQQPQEQPVQNEPSSKFSQFNLNKGNNQEVAQNVQNPLDQKLQQESQQEKKNSNDQVNFFFERPRIRMIDFMNGDWFRF